MTIMKKWTKIMLVFAFVAISCTKEGNGYQTAKYESFRLNAVSETTKTHLDGADVIWDEGDALSAFSANAATHTNNKLECVSYGTNTASFSGQIESGTTSFYAVYPYGSLTYTDGVISGSSIPATQTATNGSFANGVSLAMAAGTRTPGNPDCGNLTFKNLCAVLSFTLPSDIDFANRIVVTSKSGAGMAGAVSIDCAKQIISGASASSVTLNGTFAGGGTYYVAVAPGTYADGFRFTITSDKGNSYTRETTKTVPAEAGKIYPLGTLSLALADADFTHSVTIAHNYQGLRLTGSTATLNVEVNKSEFADAVKEIRVENVKLVRNAVTYCTLSSHSVGGSRLETNLTNTSSTPYIPKGDYSYSADVCYTVTSSAGKTTGRKLSISGKANSASPDATKFTVDANINGYTSYSCYKGIDGQSRNVNTANGKENATIYNVSATFKSGLTPAVYNQCSNLITIKTYIDNVEASGDVGEQSWGSHTISASVSFDGSNPTTCPTTRTVHITGLPYNRSNSSTTKFKGDWSFSGETGEWDDDNSRYILKNGATATFKGFYIPADVNGTVDYRIEAYVPMIAFDLTTRFNVGSTSVINETISGRNITVEYKATESVSFTSAENTITCQSISSSSLSTSQVRVYHIGVTYR